MIAQTNTLNHTSLEIVVMRKFTLVLVLIAAALTVLSQSLLVSLVSFAVIGYITVKFSFLQ